MTLSLALHNDRAPLRTLDKELQIELKQRGLVTSGGKNVSFCGLVYSEGEINAFLPRATRISASNEEIKIKIASEMMAAIHRYSTTKKNQVNADDEGSEFSGLSRLSAIVWLLNDFRINGLFCKRKQRMIVNSGKPNWRKTISKRTAFLCDNGPIYLDIDGELNYRFIGDEISKIHADVIRKLDDQFSWLISSKKSHISSSLQSIPAPSGKTFSQILHLKAQRHSHYATRDIELINHLVDFLEETRGQNHNSFVMGMKHFHGMWENMLHNTLNWTVKVNNELPIPAYKLNDGSIVEAPSKGQRTDIVLRRPNTDQFAVADAKYYETRKSTKSAPGWPDLVKQFFYAKALGVYSDSAQVSNAFIFPGESGVITSAHMKNRQTGTLEDTEYPAIKCLYVCPRQVIQHYIKGKKLTQLSEDLF
ncbi:LlaJI family restriction endonuclease [Vibrio sp. 10N.286.51.B11]|uniref:LlaJI family restriction endonuclease n=1 Tax=Vibrio sp. 10N.286.51.B11 TaxID=3229706 RepID=UPI003552C6CD